MARKIRFPDKATYEQLYGSAMEIQTQKEADEYFEALAERHMRLFKTSRREAERVERINLGYYAGYYGNETRLRVERLFKCFHPILGKAAETPVSPERALELGKEAARKRR